MVIKILGMGCSKCKKLAENAKSAVEELGIDATIEKVTELDEIAEYGVARTPGLVIDDEVKIFGKVATVEEIKKVLN